MSIARVILSDEATTDGTVAVLSSRRTVGRLRSLKHHFSRKDEEVFRAVRSLQCGYGITDFELHFVSKLFLNLSRLVLSHSEYLTGKGMKCLRNLPILERLEISECANLRDGGLGDLSRLVLKKLVLRKLDWLTAPGLQTLNPVRLEYLEITNCPKITDVSLAILKGWPIQELVLNANCLTDVGIFYLKQLPNLKELTIYGNSSDSPVLEEPLKLIESLKLNKLVLIH